MGSLQQQSVLRGERIAWSNQDVLVHQMFRKISSVNSEKAAIIYESENEQEHSVTYGELDSSSNRIARILRKICKPRENLDPIVAVSMRPSLGLPLTLLSILKSGMAYLPLDAEFPSSRVKHIIQESEPLMVIIDANGEFKITFLFHATVSHLSCMVWRKSLESMNSRAIVKSLRENEN